MRARLALVLLGAWIALSLGMGAVATVNFRTVDRLIEPGYRPELGQAVAPRTPAGERTILRYLASELNRRFFRGFAWVQVALALAVAGLVAGESGLGGAGKAALALGIALMLVNVLVLMPPILRDGPRFDFVPRPVPAELADAHRRFMRGHGLYMGVELAKLACLVVGAGALLRVRDWPPGGMLGPGRDPRRLAGRAG